MLAGAVVVFLAQGPKQGQQRVFIGGPVGQGNHLWFAQLHPHVGCQHLGDAIQRVLRSRDYLAFYLAGPMKSMHHLRRDVHHAGCMNLKPVTVEQHLAATALQVQQLQQAFVTVCGNLPVVRARALGYLLHMQGFVPHRLRGFTVQGVIGDLVHGVVIVLFSTRYCAIAARRLQGAVGKLTGMWGWLQVLSILPVGLPAIACCPEQATLWRAACTTTRSFLSG
ncbi:hypothetical protein D3C76_413290 [compost metagenome]